MVEVERVEENEPPIDLQALTGEFIEVAAQSCENRL